MASFHSTYSQYKNTQVTDFYLDQWESISFETSENDEYVVVQSKYENRPDLLANDYYGTPRLWWVFSVANKDTIIDPIRDLVAGMEIRIPPADTVRNALG